MAFLENEPKPHGARPAVRGVGLAMRRTPIFRTKMILVAVILAAAIFLLDLLLPLGVAGGVPYAVLVIAGWWFEKTRNIFVLAAISSVLIVAGYYLSAEGGIAWMVLTNRSLALLVVWATAILLAKAKRADLALQDSEHVLQERVAMLENAERKLERQGEDLVRMADDLKLTSDEALIASQAKSEFLATMSHELRTPLNAIIGFSEVMKDEMLGPVGNVKYHSYAGDIHSSGQHLLDLINDILDLSKVESGKDELHEEDIEVSEVIRAVVRLVKQRAEVQGVKLILDTPDGLPKLRADKRKLKQILVNLMTNSVKFTEAGGTVKIGTRCSSDGGWEFEVVDTGIGIAPEDVTKAFSQFGQVDGDLSRTYEGTGLGLPLTKALTEQHGGSIELQSEIGFGTTIIVRFPASRVVLVEHHKRFSGQPSRKTG